MTLLIALLLLIPPQGGTYRGIDRQLRVHTPRVDAVVTVDGRLDEPVWRDAAVLTGFSQYAPVDGRPAEDSTQVLVWYSPTAIHFGVRAFEAHGAVHATLADRDRIEADDNVQILLSTFNDGRRAVVFAVNPLGIQADGTITESEQARNIGFTTGGAGGRTPADPSADFVFDSKGRLTEYGFEVEIRIPFKSLRFQQQRSQSWGINIVRRVQHSGHEDSWAPAVQASASFLSQSGTLQELVDLERGVVLDLTPEMTAKADGGPTVGDRWTYTSQRPDLGGTAVWGITNNLTGSGTINPDFSQIESDAGQLVFDPRQVVFFPEKRPFFLDGIEHFSTPHNLIFTRRIVRPVAAAKLTGKAAGTNLALLSAVDEREASASGRDHPLMNLLRLKRDFGGESQLGLVYTGRVDGERVDHLAGADAQLLFGTIYTGRAQAVMSSVRDGTGARTAPLWELGFDRNGRRFGAHYVLTGIADDFVASGGAVPRRGIVHTNLMHGLTLYGARGALIESWEGNVQLDGTWRYRDFVGRRPSQDQKLHLNNTFTLRGGWQLTGSWFIEAFGYDSLLFPDYYVERRTATRTDTTPFVGTPHIPNSEWFVNVATPQFEHVSGKLIALYGYDENFFEWASTALWIVDASVDLRPTDKLRLGVRYALQNFARRSDGSRVYARHIPRLKLEYQIARPLLIRLVGQYDSQYRDDLRDDGRTYGRLLVRDPSTGAFTPLSTWRDNRFRGDWLLAYRPNPGTVFFAGYGSSLADAAAPSVRGLRREADGFFVKASYLFRM